jgi:hypothetical protein
MIRSAIQQQRQLQRMNYAVDEKNRWVPFLRPGAWIFHADGPRLSIAQIFNLIRHRCAARDHCFVDCNDARTDDLADRGRGAVYQVLAALLRRVWTRAVIN